MGIALLHLVITISKIVTTTTMAIYGHFGGFILLLLLEVYCVFLLLLLALWPVVGEGGCSQK